MSCLSPKVGHLIDKDGKRYLRFVSGSLNDVTNDFDSWNAVTRSGYRTITVPCGRCIECRLAYSRDWANRIILESLSYDPASCWMLTLTYDDKHLPEQLNIGQSQTFVSHPLVKKDLQDFMKRLRRRVEPDRIRFFACGEYGDQNDRPHYHVVVFGLQLSDLQYYSRSKSGEAVFQSLLVSQVWKLGLAWVSELTWNSAAYVARYVVKKQYGKSAVYNLTGKVPEFVLMSRKPGIGDEWFSRHESDLRESMNFPVLKGDQVIVQPLPRYFVKKLHGSPGFSFARDKQFQKSVRTVWQRVQNTSLTPDQQLEYDRHDAASRLSRLRRSL